VCSHRTSVPRLCEIFITLRCQTHPWHLDTLTHVFLLLRVFFKMLSWRLSSKRRTVHFLCSSRLNNSFSLVLHLVSKLLLVKHHIFLHVLLALRLLQLTWLETSLVVLQKAVSVVPCELLCGHASDRLTNLVLLELFYILASLLLVLLSGVWHGSHHVVVDEPWVRLYLVTDWELLIPCFVLT